MSERGVFAVDRGIWEHDLLTDSEPFSRREAWLWLVSEAAWKPHRRRIIGRHIELERGELVASSRFIASKWRWSESRVRRFLVALVSENMIDARTDAGVNVITICKYDDYQRVSLPSDATRKINDDAGATQERRKGEDKEYKEADDADAARAGSTPLVSPEAVSISNEVAALCGHSLEFLPPGWCGAPMTVQGWLNEGWHPAMIRTACQQAVGKKRGKPPTVIHYFSGAIAEFIALQSTPLPTIKIQDQEIIHVARKNTPAASPITAAIDAHIERFRREAAPEIGGGGDGEVAARLLPHR